jgi:hypothetical protein
VIIFATTMVLLYLSSTIYHALLRTKIKRLFRLFDHSAIFLLIAGTYTPFALGALGGVWGWTLFNLVWLLAILGIGFKALGGLQYRWLSTGLYVGMGWMAVFAIRQFWLHYPWRDCSGSLPEGSPTLRESCSTLPSGSDTATSSGTCLWPREPHVTSAPSSGTLARTAVHFLSRTRMLFALRFDSKDLDRESKSTLSDGE